jgi:hypothetical protein
VKEHIEYEDLIKTYPWIIEKEKDAIISPDSDGFLCGLLMSSLLGWKIRGFYDGKILLLKRGIKSKDCIFLDMDIYRADIKSIGHHMVMFNKLHLPNNWHNFNQCIQINNIRNYDFYNDFTLKYPLATIHLLIGILGRQQQIDIPKSAICPLLFTDGVWMNLFQYTENSLDWIKFLKAEDNQNPLNKVFCNEHYSVYEMMIAMDNFLRKRDKICAPRAKGARERGDRLIISTAEGYYNLNKAGEVYSIKDDAKNRAEQFLKLLSDLTKWDYKAGDWAWGDLKISIFTKDIFSKMGRVSNRDFVRFIESNPLSYAITSNQRIEYTLEKPDKL